MLRAKLKCSAVAMICFALSGCAYDVITEPIQLESQLGGCILQRTNNCNELAKKRAKEKAVSFVQYLEENGFTCDKNEICSAKVDTEWRGTFKQKEKSPFFVCISKEKSWRFHPDAEASMRDVFQRMDPGSAKKLRDAVVGQDCAPKRST